MKRILIIWIIVSLLTSCDNTKKETKADSVKIDNLRASEELKIVIGTGIVEPESGILKFAAPMGGIVKSVFKKDGDSVAKNETIVLLIDDAEQNKINEIRSQIQTQRSQIVIEQTQIEEAQINLNSKTNLLNKGKSLVISGAETQQAIEDLTNDVNIYQVNIDRAKAKVKYANSKLSELFAQLKTAETEAQMKVFKAPLDGKILDISVEKGEAVSQYAVYVEFAPNGNIIIKAQVDELFSSKLKVEQQVDIFYRGNDKVIATGEVITVLPYLKKKSIFSEKTDEQEDRRVREIRISLKNSDGLIINSKVDCKIKL